MEKEQKDDIIDANVQEGLVTVAPGQRSACVWGVSTEVPVWLLK